MTSLNDLLNVSEITVEYETPDANVIALDRVSLAIPSKSYSLGIVGESGSGKTTLAMSIMNAIESPGKITHGEVRFDGRDILAMSRAELLKYRWEKVAIIYQSAMNSLNPVKNVRDPIHEVLQQHKHMSAASATAEAERLLAEVGIKGDRVLDYPHEFSGGMKQRVVIALALALSPSLLVADEPTSALDVVTAAKIQTLIKNEVIDKERSLIYITHEIALLRNLVKDLALMYAGEVVEIGPLEKVLRNPLHPYTEMLLSTLLSLDSTSDVLSRADVGKKDTDVIRAIIQKAGCKYVGRCPYAFQRCQVERPKLIQVEDGRWVACHKYH